MQSHDPSRADLVAFLLWLAVNYLWCLWLLCTMQTTVSLQLQMLTQQKAITRVSVLS